jgi:hypothetical protein
MLNKIVALALFLLCPIASGAFAATSPIGAKAVHVEGDSRVISAKTAKESRISVGSIIEEGDRIRTSRNGIVEVEFDNGNLIRVDVDSDMTIRALNRDEKGSTFSIFNLVLGRVKSAVSKLTTADSKFEYHTKAAICGVGGTPPFVVEFRDDRINIDLLGKPGDMGHVYVQAFDPAKTMVTLLAGTHTAARFGQPPIQPAPIPPDRLQMLNRTIPFSSKIREGGGGDRTHGGSGERREGTGEPGGVGGAGGSIGERLVATTLTNNLSIPRQTGAANAQTLTGMNALTSSQQGAVGTETQSGGGTGSNSPPPVATFNLNVNFR